jgi:hypothetical protein
MKRLPTNVVPIKTTLNFTSFILNYKKAKLYGCPKAISTLLTTLQDQFNSWDYLVVNKKFTQDSFENKLNNLFRHFDFYQISFKDLCNEAFLLHLKKETKIYKNYNYELKFFYYLSKEIKSFLFKLIRKILQLYKRDFSTNSTFILNDTYALDIYLDTNYLKSIEKDNLLLYSAYLFFLVNFDLSVYSLKAKFKLSLKQSKILHEELCQLIETLPLSN